MFRAYSLIAYVLRSQRKFLFRWFSSRAFNPWLRTRQPRRDSGRLLNEYLNNCIIHNRLNDKYYSSTHQICCHILLSRMYHERR